MAFEIRYYNILNKNDIEFVTEFPCFLGHPVYGGNNTILDGGNNTILYMGENI